MRVVLANSGHNHGYQTALALQEAGILHRFVTGIYYDRSRWRIRALEGMVRRYGSPKDRLRLAGRHQPGLVSRSVVPLVFAELIEQAWPTLPGLRSSIPISTITHMRNELFDLQVASRHVHDCDVFHGFEQCAKFSLRRARKNGATTILDEPIIHRSLLDRTEREVREQLGVPPLRHAPGYQMHVDRKYAELEVADYLFVGLRFVKDSYVAEGFPESRIVVIPYGADTSRFRPKDEPVRGGPLKILFVGQLSWFKGLHHLLAIFEALPVEATLTIIGSAHEEWRTYFEKRLSSMSRPVRYLQTVPSLAIEAHFAEADVFVFPSLVGGIGLAVYEAMASGLPVVTSDGDVVIRDEVDGLVAPARDTDAWVKALTRLHDEPELRRRLGKRAAERAREFTWSSYRRGVRDAYAGVVEASGFTR
jgi:glycosyltransferase involved in cell wall biosynthesis